ALCGRKIRAGPEPGNENRAVRPCRESGVRRATDGGSGFSREQVRLAVLSPGRDLPDGRAGTDVYHHGEIFQPRPAEPGASGDFARAPPRMEMGAAEIRHEAAGGQ